MHVCDQSRVKIKNIWAIVVIRHNDLPSETRWPSPHSNLLLLIRLLLLTYLVLLLFNRLQCIFAGQWTRYDVLQVHLQTADKVHQALFFPCLFIDLKAGVILARREAKVAGRSEAQG
jgi:hypothetical protein